MKVKCKKMKFKNNYIEIIKFKKKMNEFKKDLKIVFYNAKYYLQKLFIFLKIIHLKKYIKSFY